MSVTKLFAYDVTRTTIKINDVPVYDEKNSKNTMPRKAT